MRQLWLAIGLVGCGDSGNKTADAQLDGPAHGDAAIDAPAFVPGAAMSHTLFLQTEGVLLVLGNSDATMNKSPLLTSDQTLASWRGSDAQRTTELAGIVTQMRTVLAPYHIDVVTTRPALGPYDMIIATDTLPQSIGLPAQTFAVTESPAAGCNTIPSKVAIMFPGQFGTMFTSMVANFIANESIAMFGFTNGVPASNLAGDCMCFSGSACGGPSTACTIGGPNTPIDPAMKCGDNAPTMDENAIFLAAFGPH